MTNPRFHCFGWNKWSHTETSAVIQAKMQNTDVSSLKPAHRTRVISPPPLSYGGLSRVHPRDRPRKIGVARALQRATCERRSRGELA